MRSIDFPLYVKLGTPLEEADIINRFEIRLRNERAYYAVRDLLTYYDAEQTAFSIINQYVRFVDEEADKRKNDWKLNDRWAWFIGDNRQSLKLTTKPEPYTLDRTLRWVQRQVAPTLKMLKRIDKDSVDLIRDSLFSIQVEQPWLLLQFGNSNAEEIGADRVEALVSASPEDEDGKTREEVVKTEIEDNDNNNLTIPQVVNRLGMVFFLLFFNLGITIFVFLLTGMMLFSQILFIMTHPSLRTYQ